MKTKLTVYAMNQSLRRIVAFTEDYSSDGTTDERSTELYGGLVSYSETASPDADEAMRLAVLWLSLLHDIEFEDDLVWGLFDEAHLEKFLSSFCELVLGKELSVYGSIQSNQDAILILQKNIHWEPILKVLPLRYLYVDGGTENVNKEFLKRLVLAYPENIEFMNRLKLVSMYETIIKELMRCLFVENDLTIDYFPESIFFESSGELNIYGLSTLEAIAEREPFKLSYPTYYVEGHITFFTRIWKPLAEPHFNVLTEDDFSCDDRMQTLKDPSRPAVVILRASSKYNMAFDKGRQLEYQLGRYIDLGDHVVVMVVGMGKELTPDIISRCYSKYNFELAKYHYQRFIEPHIESHTASSPFRAGFNGLPVIVEPLRLAQMEFSNVATHSGGGCVVIESEDEYGFVLRNPSSVMRLGAGVPPSPKDIMRADTSYIPLVKSQVHGPDYLVRLIALNGVEASDLAGFFGRMVICLPEVLDSNTYQLVYWENGTWFIKCNQDSYQVAGLKFYQTESILSQDFKAMPIDLRVCDKELGYFYFEADRTVCMETRPVRELYDGMMSFIKSDNMLTIFQGVPAIGKDFNVAKFGEGLQCLVENLVFRTVTAGADLPLVEQAMIVAEEAMQSGARYLILKIAELNLCSSDSIAELLLWARQCTLEIKIIGTQNCSSFGSDRFLLHGSLSEYIVPLSDFQEEDYVKIVKVFWTNAALKHNAIGDLDVEECAKFHIECVESCRKHNMMTPSLRALEQLVESYATFRGGNLSVINDIYDKYLPGYFGGSVGTRWDRTLYPCVRYTSHTDELAVLSSVSELKSGETVIRSAWSGSRSGATNERFRIRLREPFHIQTEDSANPSYLSRTLGPKEACELACFPGTEDSEYIVSVMKRDGSRGLEGDYDIVEGVITNRSDQELIVKVVTTKPLIFLSRVVTTLHSRLSIGNHVLVCGDSHICESGQKVLEQFVKRQMNDASMELTRSNLLNALKIDTDNPNLVFLHLVQLMNVFTATPSSKRREVEGLGEEETILLHALENKEGVCRHQATLLRMLLNFFGFHAKVESNGSHVFVVVDLNISNHVNEKSYQIIVDLSYFRSNVIKVAHLKILDKLYVVYKNYRTPESFGDYLKSHPDFKECLISVLQEFRGSIGESSEDLFELYCRYFVLMFYFPNRCNVNPWDLYFRKSEQTTLKPKVKVTENTRPNSSKGGGAATVRSSSRAKRVTQCLGLESKPKLIRKDCCLTKLTELKNGADLDWTIEQIQEAIANEFNLSSWLLGASRLSNGLNSRICQAVALSIISQLPRKQDTARLLLKATETQFPGRIVAQQIIGGETYHMVMVSKPVVDQDHGCVITTNLERRGNGVLHLVDHGIEPSSGQKRRRSDDLGPQSADKRLRSGPKTGGQHSTDKSLRSGSKPVATGLTITEYQLRIINSVLTHNNCPQIELS